MKKLILTILFLLSGTMSFASCDCLCVAPYDLTCGVSRFFSKITGQNFLVEKIAEHLIKKEVKKEFQQGKIKASLKSYSVRDLKAGRFKSVEISGKDLISDGAYITSFKAKTVCDFNYIEAKDDNIIIKENVPVAFEAVITEDDLNRAIESFQYKKLINDINNYIGGLFVIEASAIRLRNDKMYYVINYSGPFSKKKKEAVFSTNLYINNGQIDLGSVVLEINRLHWI